MLFLIPLGVSVLLSLFFLLDDDPAPIAKGAVVCWIGLSVLLQFALPVHFLIPFLMQVLASIVLFFWCKANEVI